MARFYIVELLNPAVASSRYRVIEKVDTVDGVRDRITNHCFPTLERAEAFVTDMEERLG